MIAKLIVSAQTREEAIVKMERALSEFIIEGVKTTIPLHIQLMKDKNFREGNFTTKFMESFKLK
jgi:acetyl-CoA carboxylase biotin carboxylase subunit